KDIFVMGHTDCKAIKACLRQNEKMLKTRRYLSPLNTARDRIAQAHGVGEESARLLGEESVRQSLKNLLGIPAIKTAAEQGKVRVNGWILDTEKGHGRPIKPLMYEHDL